ncbi:Uma2 family endonuclease [Thermicanus aegyptius]|uniref:Uma2 family endonuclease n=1 Tax=Thermicanus aegyptius TaxID=94009 RepID=UPI0004265C41|nr:Uma2 family endonuclease [Thermicanus aegyptius]
MSHDKTSKRDNSIKEQQGDYEISERYEIINGIRYDFLSSPKYVHQKLLSNLHLAFHSACGSEGEILLAPLDVHFDEENIVQPDLIYIRRERMEIIRDGYIFGVPDLVVEIMSESTGKRDKTIKKKLYERFGVKEYWVVDPVYRLVEQFVLDNGRYLLEAILTEQDRLNARTVHCLTLDLKEIFPQEDQ